MSNKENLFINSEEALKAAPPSSPQSHTEPNLQHIRINDISGPLVVLFGPRDIGKTVTLIRLCNYISRYEIKPNINFRTDRAEYKRTVDTFEAIRKDVHFAPGATGTINFLLLDVTYQGNNFCQILEAPGEHFFEAQNPNKDYPAYFHQILNSKYRKVFLFFFELNMFDSDQDRQNYANKLALLTREKIDSRRDRVIIVCNKCDLQPYIRNGKPIDAEFKNALYKREAFSGLKDILSKSGFGRVPFLPFSAGAFTDDGRGRLAFAPSPEHYPQRLWNEIHECIVGTPWWKVW
jgi:hypothetical protein